MKGDTFQKILAEFRDPELRERYLNEAYKSALAHKIERLKEEGLIKKAQPIQKLEKFGFDFGHR